MASETSNPDDMFRNHLADGRLCMQRSKSSGAVFWYPRVIAPGTGASDLEWVELSGHGEVYATTTVRERPPSPGYNVSLIDLDEGVRIMSRVEGIAPDAVRIGMKVAARIATGPDAEPLVVFDPVPAAA